MASSGVATVPELVRTDLLNHRGTRLSPWGRALALGAGRFYFVYLLPSDCKNRSDTNSFEVAVLILHPQYVSNHRPSRSVKS